MPRIAIEDKHTYNSLSTFLRGNISTTAVTTVLDNFIQYEPYYPVQGTDENNRVGRKIQSRFISEEGYLTINFDSIENSLLDYWSGFIEQQMTDLLPNNYEFPVSINNLSIPIRHFIVEFQDDDFYEATSGSKATYLKDWFQNLVIQSGTFTIPSNTMNTLRESTPYTGRFSILKDDIYWLDFNKKHTIHFKYKLPYKRTIAFDAAGSDPTNSHVFSVWIAPLNPLFDYNNRAFGKWMEDTEEIVVSPVVARLDTTVKLVYNDI